MSKKNNKKIFVFADWQFLKKTSLMGILNSEVLRGKEIFSFEYKKEWLDSVEAQVIDPDLKLYSGRQYLTGGNEKINFGLFLDSSPDRWGRVLMLRREAALARIEKREAKTLLETDYLLGIISVALFLK